MRSDAFLQREVERELRRDPRIELRRLDVEVDNGVVTLSGEVSSPVARACAERAAERVADVRAVANEIKTRDPQPRHDTDIAKVAANLLEWNAWLAGEKIMVEVEDGWVTLTGHVAREDQRQEAEAVVRPLHGVKGINNLIRIEPLAPPDSSRQPGDRSSPPGRSACENRSS